MNIIETHNLTKTYRRFIKKEGIRGSIQGLFHREYEEKTAVRDMNLAVKEGEFLGVIGPNGAGKTTLIKMLTGIIAPTAGEINVLGYYPNELKNEFKKQYAVVMGQKSQLFYELTVNDTIRLFKEIYEISDEEFKRNRDFFVEVLGVQDLMDVQVRTLSLGERMKMELMAALLHNPRLLFLDEPTIGLDAVASRQIRSFLKTVNKEKKTTILLTSHYMEDIKALCDRSIVIRHGEKIYDGGTGALFECYQKERRISVTFADPMEKIRLSRKLDGQATVITEEPHKKVLRTAKEYTNVVLKELMAYEPIDIMVEEEEISKVVERIYAEQSREDGQSHEKIYGNRCDAS